MNTVSGRKISGDFWNIISVYMQFFDTIGDVRVVRGQKIGQNEHMYDFLALFVHFHIIKNGNEYIFW